MNSPPFSQNYNSTGKSFLAGKPADAGTLGPYPRSGSDPESVKNGFVARLAKNPPAKSQVPAYPDADQREPGASLWGSARPEQPRTRKRRHDCDCQK